MPSIIRTLLFDRQSKISYIAFDLVIVYGSNQFISRRLITTKITMTWLIIKTIIFSDVLKNFMFFDTFVIIYSFSW